MEIQERTESIVSLTPAAAAKIRDLMAGEEDVSVLRVAIEGGGCSGFQYGLGFDRGAQEGDHEFECEGVTVVVDPFSAPYLLRRPGRLPRDDPGVRVQDREPERRRLVRLRPLVPGGRGRGARGAAASRLRLRLLPLTRLSGHVQRAAERMNVVVAPPGSWKRANAVRGHAGLFEVGSERAAWSWPCARGRP